MHNSAFDESGEQNFYFSSKCRKTKVSKFWKDELKKELNYNEAKWLIENINNKKFQYLNMSKKWPHLKCLKTTQSNADKIKRCFSRLVTDRAGSATEKVKFWRPTN